MKTTKSNPVLTGHIGTNADLFAAIMSLHASEGSVVADVTYGRGVFWKNIPDGLYTLLKSDIQDGVDFSDLPYEDSSIDILVLDPPYMHGGLTVKESINKCYKNQNTSHESVVRLYAYGILEAARVLKKGGKIIVKTQDEIESGRQKHTHIELTQMLEMFGFRILDTFVLIQETTPAMREKYQLSARKNHSFALVAKFSR
jgi:DNA modification methylase